MKRTAYLAIAVVAGCCSAETNVVKVWSALTSETYRDWYRPNDWRVKAAVATEPVGVSSVSFATNAATGMITSNYTGAIHWPLSAELSIECLDRTAVEFNPGPVAYEPTNGGHMTNGTRFVAAEGGLYRVKATTGNYGARYCDIPLTRRRGEVTNATSYVADAADIGWRKAVNDAFLADLQASTCTGTGVANGVSYDVWRTVACPCRPVGGFTTSGYRSRNALSPHLLIGARHYGYNGNSSSLQFRDPVGGTNVTVNTGGLATGATAYDSVAVPQGWGFPLCAWALTNGFTRAELAAMGDIEDVAIYPINGGGAVPDACCPYIMSIAAWTAHFGGTGRLGGWANTQTNRGRKYDGLAAENMMTPCILDLGNMAANGHGADGWTCAAFAWPKADVRPDILARRMEMEAQGAAHAFPPIYVGDSSGGIYIRHDGRWIMASMYHSAGGGPSLSAALPVLKKLCEAYGDTLKTIEE